MKLVGIIKEHDPIADAPYLQDVLGGSELTSDVKERILKYLDEGVLVFGWMGYVFDIESKTPICPHAFYSDGIYVWPEYFKYYISKYSGLAIETEFMERALSIKDTKPQLTEEQIEKIESELVNIISPRM